MNPNLASPASPSPDSSGANFSLPPVLTVVTVIEALILLAAAIQLYHFPLWDGLRWPWAVKPFNAVFLGGLYWAAFTAVSFQILIRRWSTARLVQPMVLIFSLVLLSVSLAYFGVFNWQRRLVKAWFLIYTVVPLSSAIATFAYRARPSANPVHLPLRQQRLLRTKAIGLSLYGLALLLIPALSTAFWPWAIDAFHARLYSAIFLATGFGNWLLSRAATALELLILGSIEFLIGALACVGIVNIDRTLGRMDWSQPGGLLWLLLLGTWAIAGALLIRQSLRWRSIP